MEAQNWKEPKEQDYRVEEAPSLIEQARAMAAREAFVAIPQRDLFGRLADAIERKDNVIHQQREAIEAQKRLLSVRISEMEAAVRANTERRDAGHPDHPLMPVLLAVIEQVTSGKGTRHGGASVPFLDQPWHHYAGMHGRGFLTGQAAKKLEEAASRDLTGEPFEREVLGAIAYCAMAVLFDREAL